MILCAFTVTREPRPSSSANLASTAYLAKGDHTHLVLCQGSCSLPHHICAARRAPHRVPPNADYTGDLPFEVWSRATANLIGEYETFEEAQDAALRDRPVVWTDPDGNTRQWPEPEAMP